MTSERYQRLVDIFQAAADRGPDARPAFLAEACAGDDELRREVEAMLAADAQSGGFLDKPADDLAAAAVAARETRSLIGHRVSHYEVVSLLGAGGMGEVYRAKDTRLRREVAIKVAVASFDDRFEREARTVAALNHPNICTLHDIGPNYLVMELVEGPTLSDRIKQGPILLDEALDIARQIADALQAAHEKGIIHRDLKPANVKVTAQGRVKVLDFGLAKAIRSVEADQNLSQSGSVSGVQTLAGNIVGTPGYMSPEQAEGKALDSRSDIFSFGAVLYEMITGRRAFQGQSSASILAAVLREDPRPLCELAKDLPPDLDRIVTRCLRKDPEARYPSMTAVVQDLESCRSCLAATSSGAINLKLLAQESRQPRVFIPALLILLALVGGSARLLQRNAKARWARTQALPEITNLIDHEKFSAAYALGEEAAKYIPNDPILSGLWPPMSRTVTIETTPPGADVYRRDYDASDGRWEYAGRSPLQNLRVPLGLFQWKIVKKGYTTREGSLFPSPYGRTPLASITLDEDGKAPSGMVRVSPGTVPVPLQIAGFEDLAPVPLEDFWIDKYEVTNEQFKEFVDQGGYQKQDYWKQEFRKNGRVLSWAEAI
jgi:serine/threonine protein kinase